MRQKKRNRRNEIIRVVLGIIATAGVIGVALVAPNAVQAFARLGLLPGQKPTYKKYYIRTTVTRLKEKGLVSVGKNSKGISVARLTESGQKMLATYELGRITPNRQKRWDGKWRVVVFDIHEHRRDVRSILRGSLRSFGFAYLQQSVWVFPYPCEEFVVLLKTSLHLGASVRYMVVEKMEHDRALKKFFLLEN